MTKENIENSVIYTDSLSDITPLHYRNAAQPIIRDIIDNVVIAEMQGHKIKFFWVPIVGISGNERAGACVTQDRCCTGQKWKNETIKHSSQGLHEIYTE